MPHAALALAGTVVVVEPRAHAAGARANVPAAERGACGHWHRPAAVGLGLAATARFRLGGNWSAAVEIKEDQALIRTGLYRHVRHPIYSGRLLALFGSGVALERGRALLVRTFASPLIKARREEERLRHTFGDDARSARETAALIPFLVRSLCFVNLLCGRSTNYRGH